MGPLSQVRRPWEAGRARSGRAEGRRLSADLLSAGPELLADELQHRLRIEAAVAKGAKNVVKLLGSRRTQDRKALAEVRPCPLPLLLFSEGLLVSSPHSGCGLCPAVQGDS